MKSIATRKSWDTALKHLTRHGILGSVLSPSQIGLIPSSNISRWKAESDDKYLYCEINQLVADEIELIVIAKKETEALSTPIRRVGQHVIATVLEPIPGSGAWHVTVEGSPWRASSETIADINGGLDGLKVDFDKDDLDKEGLVIVSNTDNTLVIQLVPGEVLDASNGDILIGIHEFATLTILGGASVDFGDDRLTMLGENGVLIDAASSVIFGDYYAPNSIGGDFAQTWVDETRSSYVTDYLAESIDLQGTTVISGYAINTAGDFTAHTCYFPLLR